MDRKLQHWILIDNICTFTGEYFSLCLLSLSRYLYRGKSSPVHENFHLYEPSIVSPGSLYGIIPAYVIKALACSLNPTTCPLAFIPWYWLCRAVMAATRMSGRFRRTSSPKSLKADTRWSTSPLDKGTSFNLVRVSSASFNLPPWKRSKKVARSRRRNKVAAVSPAALPCPRYLLAISTACLCNLSRLLSATGGEAITWLSRVFRSSTTLSCLMAKSYSLTASSNT